MIREVSGYNGQVVTSWGGDLVGDLWTGKPKPVETTVICRCGKECTYAGFATKASTLGEGWVSFLGEYFCSYICVREHRRLEAQEEARRQDSLHVVHLARYIALSQALRGPQP